MTGKRKGLIAAGIVAAGVILVLIGVAGHRDDGPKVEVSKVEPRTVRSSILAGGVMNYLDPVELKPQVIGRIIAIPVKEGQRVRPKIDSAITQIEIGEKPDTSEAHLSVAGRWNSSALKLSTSTSWKLLAAWPRSRNTTVEMIGARMPGKPLHTAKLNQLPKPCSFQPASLAIRK